MKILVPVDGSPYTKHMLAYLAAHEEWSEAGHEFTVLHCPAPMPPRAAAVIPREQVLAYYAGETERVFKPIRSFFRQRGMPAEFVSKSGEAWQRIVEVATKGRFGMVMMGSHGHGPIGALVTGSVTARVLAHSKVPVLIIR